MLLISGDWLKKGFAYGPVPLSQVPKEAKFNCLMTRDKPNGSVRIILNLSSPDGMSVNEGIRSEDFPTVMSSTTEWLRVLKKAGRNCYFVKIDWADAYKHLHVRPEDLNLQWFEWLGKAFQELCLIFGSASSAGIFDATAKIIVFIVRCAANFDPSMLVQHLDDLCAALPRHRLAELEKFDKLFFQIAADLGISLASRDDPDKSFGPSTSGVVLGVFYDTVKWTWKLPTEKLLRLQLCIQEILPSQSCLQHKMWTIVGKIINICPLVPTGKYNIDHLLRANSESKKRNHLLLLSDDVKKQLRFWHDILPLCANMVAIPDPDPYFPAGAIQVWTDAAGGSHLTGWNGVGAVTDNWWAYMPWGHKINAGKDAGNNRKLDRVMSALELLGPLLTISAGYKWCARTAVKVWVDNMASVSIWHKGYSTSCPLSSCLVKAIAVIAGGIGCQITVEKITRCSDVGSELADSLSKGDFQRFHAISHSNAWSLPSDMAWVPWALKQWVSNPRPDDDLGHKILQELAQFTPVLSYNL